MNLVALYNSTYIKRAIKLFKEKLSNLDQTILSPNIVVDSRGILHCLWVSKDPAYKYVTSEDNGVTWQVPQL